MALVTGSEVLAIFSEAERIEDSAGMAPFIDAAVSIMEDLGLTSKEVQRWLSAHFAAQYDRALAEERIGGAADTYEGKTGMGLSNTHYGQQAMFLDTTGKLAKAENNPTRKQQSVSHIDITDISTSHRYYYKHDD